VRLKVQFVFEKETYRDIENAAGRSAEVHQNLSVRDIWIVGARGFWISSPLRAILPSRLPLRAKSVKSEPGPPMTLGNAATARVRLIVWCKGCQH
jgi:hypothetical protein